MGRTSAVPRRLWFALALAASALASCGDTAASAPVACDPLATTTLPITMGTFVAAGKDAAGTVYFIDDAGSGNKRLFISSGQVLQRQPVGGSGEIDGSYLILATAEIQVAVEMGPGGPQQMGVHRGPLAGKTFVIGSEGEVLSLLGASDLRGFTLANLPGAVNVEHFGTLPDGRVLLVTSPAVDHSYDEFRVFFGPSDRLVERKNLQISRGSYTRLSFDDEGQLVQAVFGSPLAPAVMSEITVDGQTQPLTVAPPGARPQGATYFCLGR
jgi:hypothetical protein